MLVSKGGSKNKAVTAKQWGIPNAHIRSLKLSSFFPMKLSTSNPECVFQYVPTPETVCVCAALCLQLAEPHAPLGTEGATEGPLHSSSVTHGASLLL